MLMLSIRRRIRSMLSLLSPFFIIISLPNPRSVKKKRTQNPEKRHNLLSQLPVFPKHEFVPPLTTSTSELHAYLT
ncbi:hypothetical protein F4811DRAFT_28166 [Daldinia bambusicola]|nr:hypothetical protein F4811DRAFT_28166 [Daldinia bambusicola]